jgi:hypothetical protein
MITADFAVNNYSWNFRLITIGYHFDIMNLADEVPLAWVTFKK